MPVDMLDCLHVASVVLLCHLRNQLSPCQIVQELCLVKLGIESASNEDRVVFQTFGFESEILMAEL